MNPDEQVVFREYPLVFWFVGNVPLFATAGVIVELSTRVVFAALGVFAIAFASVMTVSVDWRRGTLNLHYRSLVRNSTKSYALRDISFVNVKEDSEGTYRVEVFLWSGEVVPLRSTYSAGRRSKERQARRLRAALGI